DAYIGVRYSLSSFVSGYKYAVLHHFCENPLSILTTVEPEEAHSRIELLTESHIEIIRMQLSFREYVESQLHQPKEVHKLLCDNDYVKTLLPVFLRDMKNYHQKFGATFELAFFSQECLSYDSSHTKMRHELYSLALKKPGLGESCFILKLVDDLMKLEYKDLGILLRTWIDYLEDVSNVLGIMTQECQDIIGFLDQLEVIYENESESLSTEVKGKYRKLKTELRNYMLIFFEENLRHYSSNTLYEIFYYQDYSVLESVLTPKPRQAIHAALGLPTDYIKCNCCEFDEDDGDCLDPREQILSTHPDTSILYKLHLQCGKLINIYDWLESFESVISRDNLENGKIDDKEVRARFIKGYEELKILGIIGPTSRKKDHLKRVAWGTS
ncbi:5213_t:CDS:2, partial [Acaulospora morrowiae]